MSDLMSVIIHVKEVFYEGTGSNSRGFFDCIQDFDKKKSRICFSLKL